MRVAVSVCSGQVAPVLDFAEEMVIYELQPGNGSYDELERVDLREMPFKSLLVPMLIDRKVEALVCGRVSRPLAWMLHNAGIRIVSSEPVDPSSAVANASMPPRRPGGPGRGRGHGRRGGARFGRNRDPWDRGIRDQPEENGNRS
ncbi:hypothetical protein GF402_11035 [Candidatus Fermentibacteria bacterium]|nr:hypothetical protein [Candidatus Fermentibacteria bacterium]